MNTANKLAQIAKENRKPTETSEVDTFRKKISYASHTHVEYLKQKCEELALKGYGSVKITLDQTTDLFNIIEEAGNSYYSANHVMSLLNVEGFTWKNEVTNHYYAFSDVLVWERDLPQAPDSEKIGMSWE